MYETCKSCGTVFEVNKHILTKQIQWLKCGVCNEKWALSYSSEQNLIKKNTETKNKDEKVKRELASIKSIVEDKSKFLAKKPNPVLDQKNKSVAEIASELSLSKLNENNKNKVKKTRNGTNKKKIKKLFILPFLTIAIVLIIFLAAFFRSSILSYGFLYLPNFSEKHFQNINSLFAKIDLPIFADTKNLNLINFVAKVQDKEVTFSGMIKNISKRPMLVPRIKILGIREDRKIILEKILILDDKIIYPNSDISFKKLVRVKIQNQNNVTVKATLLKKIF